MRTGIAIVGCGFVADYYAGALRAHPQLQLLGAYDLDAQRVQRFAAHHGAQAYPTLAKLLDDADVRIVVNLTSPASHYEVSSAALRVGKHVYSEKPMTLEVAQARDLIDIARAARLQISAAPCCALGESAQTLWKLLREGVIGKVRLAYAEVEDGLLHRMPHRRWQSESGAAWPFESELKLGCIRGHAGYAVSWLTMMFGPAREVTAFATRVVDSHEASGNGHACGPDVGVACLMFDGGVVARLTCGAVAPRDRSLCVFGDGGIARTRDCSDDRSPVSVRRYFTLRRRLMTGWPMRRRLVRSGLPRVTRQGAQRRDFARGISELADAVRDGRAPRLSADFCLHTTEVVLAIHDAFGRRESTRTIIRSSFAPVAPMQWAAC